MAARSADWKAATISPFWQTEPSSASTWLRSVATFGHPLGTPITPSCRRPLPFSSTFKRAQVTSRTCGAVKERRSHLPIPMGRAPSSSGSWLGLCTRAPRLATIKALAAGESRFATKLLARPTRRRAPDTSTTPGMTRPKDRQPCICSLSRARPSVTHRELLVAWWSPQRALPSAKAAEAWSGGHPGWSAHQGEEEDHCI